MGADSYIPRNQQLLYQPKSVIFNYFNRFSIYELPYKGFLPLIFVIHIRIKRRIIVKKHHRIFKI